jgi:hypothetical protein
MTGDLVELAERLIRATAEVEDIRRAMLAALTNGAGGGEGPKPNPPRAQRLGGRESQSKSQSKRSQSQVKHPNAIRAAAEEAKIVDHLRDRPGLRGAELAKALDCRPNTMTQRLQRLESRGAISRGADGAWTASAAAASA